MAEMTDRLGLRPEAGRPVSDGSRVLPTTSRAARPRRRDRRYQRRRYAAARQVSACARSAFARRRPGRESARRRGAGPAGAVVDVGAMRPGGSQLTRVAAVDCGTNSIRLLIADVNGDELVDVHRELRIVRLGPGRRRFRPARAGGDCPHRDGLAGLRRPSAPPRRRRGAHGGHERDQRRGQPRRVRGHGDEACSACRQKSSLAKRRPHCRSLGAVHSLPHVTGRVAGRRHRRRLHRADRRPGRSVGSAAGAQHGRRLRPDDRTPSAGRPPDADQIAATVRDVRHALDRAVEDVSLAEPAALIGVAGTVTTVAALAMGLDRYDPGRIHGATVPARVPLTRLRRCCSP